MSETSELHDPFRKWLRAEGLPYRYSTPGKPTSENASDADFWIVQNGRVLMVEFKQPKTGKLTTNQVFRHAELEKAGCRVFVLRTLEDAIAVVRAWRDTIGTATPVSDAPRGRLVIRDMGGGDGDWVCRDGLALRRATIDDFRTLQRA